MTLLWAGLLCLGVVWALIAAWAFRDLGDPPKPPPVRAGRYRRGDVVEVQWLDPDRPKEWRTAIVTRVEWLTGPRFGSEVPRVFESIRYRGSDFEGSSPASSTHVRLRSRPG